MITVDAIVKAYESVGLKPTGEDEGWVSEDCSRVCGLMVLCLEREAVPCLADIAAVQMNGETDEHVFELVAGVLGITKDAARMFAFGFDGRWLSNSDRASASYKLGKQAREKVGYGR